ncbi:MAG: hypothetical protein ABH869_05420 [Candidatus Omnitrophota bacterium]
MTQNIEYFLIITVLYLFLLLFSVRDLHLRKDIIKALKNHYSKQGDPLSRSWDTIDIGISDGHRHPAFKRLLPHAKKALIIYLNAKNSFLGRIKILPGILMFQKTPGDIFKAKVKKIWPKNKRQFLKKINWLNLENVIKTRKEIGIACDIAKEKIQENTENLTGGFQHIDIEPIVAMLNDPKTLRQSIDLNRRPKVEKKILPKQDQPATHDLKPGSALSAAYWYAVFSAISLISGILQYFLQKNFTDVTFSFVVLFLYFCYTSIHFLLTARTLYKALRVHEKDFDVLALMEMPIARNDGYRHDAFYDLSEKYQRLVNIHERFNIHLIGMLAMVPVVSLFVKAPQDVLEEEVKEMWPDKKHTGGKDKKKIILMVRGNKDSVNWNIARKAVNNMRDVKIALEIIREKIRDNTGIEAGLADSRKYVTINMQKVTDLLNNPDDLHILIDQERKEKLDKYGFRPKVLSRIGLSLSGVLIIISGIIGIWLELLVRKGLYWPVYLSNGLCFVSVYLIYVCVKIVYMRAKIVSSLNDYYSTHPDTKEYRNYKNIPPIEDLYKMDISRNDGYRHLVFDDLPEWIRRIIEVYVRFKKPYQGAMNIFPGILMLRKTPFEIFKAKVQGMWPADEREEDKTTYLGDVIKIVDVQGIQEHIEWTKVQDVIKTMADVKIALDIVKDNIKDNTVQYGGIRQVINMNHIIKLLNDSVKFRKMIDEKLGIQFAETKADVHDLTAQAVENAGFISAGIGLVAFLGGLGLGFFTEYKILGLCVIIFGAYWIWAMFSYWHTEKIIKDAFMEWGKLKGEIPGVSEILNIEIAKSNGYTHPAFQRIDIMDRFLLRIHEAGKTHRRGIFMMLPVFSTFFMARANRLRIEKEHMYKKAVSANADFVLQAARCSYPDIRETALNNIKNIENEQMLWFIFKEAFYSESNSQARQTALQVLFENINVNLIRQRIGELFRYNGTSMPREIAEKLCTEIHKPEDLIVIEGVIEKNIQRKEGGEGVSYTLLGDLVENKKELMSRVIAKKMDIYTHNNGYKADAQRDLCLTYDFYDEIVEKLTQYALKKDSCDIDEILCKVVNVSGKGTTFEIKVDVEMLNGLDALESKGKIKNYSFETKEELGVEKRLLELMEKTNETIRGRLMASASKITKELTAKGIIKTEKISVCDKVMAPLMLEALNNEVNMVEKAKSEGETFSAEVESAVLDIKNNIDKFEAGSLIANIIILARKARRGGQKLILGLETDWIPGYEDDGSYQHNAINPLINKIRDLQIELRKMGLDIIIIDCKGEDLASAVLKEAEDSEVDLSNVVVMASKDTIYSKAFKPLLNVANAKKPFLAVIDPAELLEAYKLGQEKPGKDICVEIMKMLLITLELASGNDVSELEIIKKYSKEKRIVLFEPKAEPVDMEEVRIFYKLKLLALKSV